MPRVGESTSKVANKLVLVMVWVSLVRAVSKVNSFPGGPPLGVVKLALSKCVFQEQVSKGKEMEASSL